MNEAGVGRVLPASLHQGIADLLPSRLDFYEEWLNPKAMRDGRIGQAGVSAVLSFLRREGEGYHLATGRAGKYAAEWTFAEMSTFRRWLLRVAPTTVRLRLVAGLMQRLSVATYGNCRARTRWRRRTGTLVLSGSLFCTVRGHAEQPLCEYYAAAMRRLMELAGVPAEVVTDRCRATGANECAMLLTVRV